jgi:hypothetical protein
MLRKLFPTSTRRANGFHSWVAFDFVAGIVIDTRDGSSEREELLKKRDNSIPRPTWRGHLCRCHEMRRPDSETDDEINGGGVEIIDCVGSVIDSNRVGEAKAEGHSHRNR